MAKEIGLRKFNLSNRGSKECTKGGHCVQSTLGEGAQNTDSLPVFTYFNSRCLTVKILVVISLTGVNIFTYLAKIKSE